MIISKNGSIVLVLLFFITALSAVMYSFIRTNSYFVSLARERELYEIRYQLAQGIHLSVIAYYKKQIQDTQTGTSPIILYKEVLSSPFSEYEGEVVCSKKRVANEVIATITTRLFYHKSTVLTLKIQIALTP